MCIRDSIGDAVLGAPVTGDHQANAFLFSQQSDVVGGLAGDKAIRARINSFLQVAAARTADFGQAGDGAAAIHVPHAAVPVSYTHLGLSGKILIQTLPPRLI